MARNYYEEEGDIFSKKGPMMHQTNCVVVGPGKYLAAEVFRRYPYAHVYCDDVQPSIPGTVIACGDPLKDERVIYNLFAQRYPNKARYNNDTPALRLKWLQEGLEKIAADLPVGTPFIYIPHGMGCTSAGGNWEDYRKAFQNFAALIPQTKVVVLKKRSPV